MAGDVYENSWKDDLKEKFSKYFFNVKVLDIGSADINGTNKPWFDNCEYTGLDVLPYQNVDIVSLAHEYNPDGLFDVVCSTSELEHDMYWQKTLQKMVDLLKPDGFMWFVEPYIWSEHGTLSTTPQDSLTSKIDNPLWNSYYKNLSVDDIKSVLDLEKIFSSHKIEYLEHPGREEISLAFWGIKKGVRTSSSI